MIVMSRLSRLCIPILALLAACSDPSARTSAGPAAAPGSAGLVAPNRAPPPDFATMKMSFSPVVKRAAPAVVSVFSTSAAAPRMQCKQTHTQSLVGGCARRDG